MSVEYKVSRIFTKIRSTGNIIPRDYQTIGGMWTVDTWEHPNIPDVKVQLMDEGWTTGIVSPELVVSTNGNGQVSFRRGGVEDLDALYELVEREIA